jgi:hypothetical protein
MQNTIQIPYSGHKIQPDMQSTIQIPPLKTAQPGIQNMIQIPH